MKNVKTSISPYEYPPSFGLIRTAIKSVWLSANGTVEALRAEARPITGKRISCLITTSERYPGARFHQNICCLVPRGCSILVALRFTPPPSALTVPGWRRALPLVLSHIRLSFLHTPSFFQLLEFSMISFIFLSYVFLGSFSPSFSKYLIASFLDVPSHLYKRVCPLQRVGPKCRLSDAC